ncbi:exported hypothetical protein [Cupriavidus taiwanensis]|nr:exported hypothetical protein [Cupriavidus taiwanensis]
MRRPSSACAGWWAKSTAGANLAEAPAGALAFNREAATRVGQALDQGPGPAAPSLSLDFSGENLT